MQCVDLRADGDDAIEQVGQIALRMDFVEFYRITKKTANPLPSFLASVP